MPTPDIKRLFKTKRWGDRAKVVHMELQGTEGTATKALYTGYHEIPRIIMAIKVPHSKDPASGESFDAIEIEMDLYKAIDFCQQLTNSIDAASPRRVRGAGQYYYGE